MEIWHIKIRLTTGWKKIMTKINIRIPEPKTEYDISNQKQINRALTLMKDQLNSTFLDEIKQEQERFSWFISG